ncbi:Domain of uncharacterised function (DUF2825) [Corynebacterium striatum]|nr:Domain of uncharacterised function (DUF2825) [Corynebacterium striatum]
MSSCCDCGLIPAYAGRTRQPRQPPPSSGAHPRLRGADAFNVSSMREPDGSSPLTRGGLHFYSPHPQRRRLIPAYAGRTPKSYTRSYGEQAHPRLRGADAHAGHRRIYPWGSSPLTRGGPVKTVGAAGVMVAHPRLRGADLMPWRGSAPRSGSSPLTRGGHPSGTPKRMPVGLIPAYAGRTAGCATGSGTPRAHPRLRGADSIPRIWPAACGGSSPLTRGGRGLGSLGLVW